MNKKDLQKPITLEVLSQFTEEVILPGVEKIIDDRFDKDIKPIENKIGKIEDKIGKIEDKMATKEDLKAMENRMVSKDYLDKKLFKLEERIISRISKDHSKIKQALVFTMKLIRSNKKTTIKQIETLKLLEYELGVN